MDSNVLSGSHKAAETKRCGTIAVVALTMLCAWSCGDNSETEVLKPRPVKVERVHSLGKTERAFSATVAADEFSDLAFKSAGLITKMYVAEGQKVKTGDVVAEIDPTDLNMVLEEKRTNYQKAAAQMERAQKLLVRSAISQQEYESTRATYINSKVAMEAAERTLKDTKLRAPFSGFIQKKYVENYQRVQSGQSVVCLINPNKLQVVTTIPETSAGLTTSASRIEVEFDAFKGVRFKAKVKEYVEASPDGAGIPVYLSIDDSKFDLVKYRVSVGFSCKAIFQSEDSTLTDRTGVPLSAIVYDENRDSMSVFVFNPNTQTVKQVSVEGEGKLSGRNMLIVKTGISDGELVVTSGTSRLTDGEKVRPLN